MSVTSAFSTFIFKSIQFIISLTSSYKKIIVKYDNKIHINISFNNKTSMNKTFFFVKKLEKFEKLFIFATAKGK